MLVSVLMLLVSVTTIADGNREVWEYWGGSCLCVYTAETERRQSQGADHTGRYAATDPPSHTIAPCPEAEKRGAVLVMFWKAA